MAYAQREPQRRVPRKFGKTEQRSSAPGEFCSLWTYGLVRVGIRFEKKVEVFLQALHQQLKLWKQSLGSIDLLLLAQPFDYKGHLDRFFRSKVRNSAL